MKKINLLLLSLVMLLFSCSKSSVSGGGSDTAPAAPTNVRITPLSDGSYYVSWVDNSTNEDGFIVTTSTGDTVVNSTTTNETKTTYTATVSSKPSNVSSRNSFGARPSNPATVDVVNITGIKITNSLGVTQIWMEKNLNVISSNMIPGESYVSSTNDSLHGKYYSMASVLDTTNKLAPNGWHIPDSIDIINFGKVYQEDRKKLGYLSEDYYNYKTKKFEPGGYIWSTRLNYLGRPFFVSISSTNQVGFVDPINNCFLNVRCLRD